MEELVRMVLSNYPKYLAESRLKEKWLITMNHEQEELARLQLKITMVQSWLSLLTTDERFVIQKHLVESIEWPRVSFLFAEMWKGEFTRTERTLLQYQSNALEKIQRFCLNHREMMRTIFDVLECTQESHTKDGTLLCTNDKMNN